MQDNKPLAGGDVLVTGGYQRLAEHMLTGVDVKYGSVVTGIDYSGGWRRRRAHAGSS